MNLKQPPPQENDLGVAVTMVRRTSKITLPIEKAACGDRGVLMEVGGGSRTITRGLL